MNMFDKNQQKIRIMKQHIYESMLDTPVELHIDNLPIKSIQSDTTKTFFYMDGRVAPFFQFRTINFEPMGPLGKFEMAYEDTYGVTQKEFVTVIFDEDASVTHLKSYLQEVKKAQKEKKAQKKSSKKPAMDSGCPNCDAQEELEFGEGSIPEEIAAQIIDEVDYEIGYDDDDQLFVEFGDQDGFIETDMELPGSAEFAVEEEDEDGNELYLVFQVSFFPGDGGYKYSVTNVVVEMEDEGEDE